MCTSRDASNIRHFLGLIESCHGILHADCFLLDLWWWSSSIQTFMELRNASIASAAFNSLGELSTNVIRGTGFVRGESFGRRRKGHAHCANKTRRITMLLCMIRRVRRDENSRLCTVIIQK